MPNSRTLPPPSTRVILSIVVPIISGVILQALVSGAVGIPAESLPGERGGASLLLAGAGAASLILGLRWYGLPQLGLRGRRPLYASIGFATLGWVVYILARVVVVASNQQLVVSPTLGQDFIYLLLSEALALQLWSFGLLFRSVADWRGPLTAAISGGLVFGLVGFVFFAEAFANNFQSLLFFLVWGLFYGLIRLRTGSIVGTVIVQAMQSLTTWYILLPEAEPQATELQLLYAIVATFFVIFVWRLWPKDEDDYRV